MPVALFGKKIEPSCAYCEWGSPDEEEDMVFCRRNGIVSAHGSCRHFQYAPLRRKPSQVQVLPKYDPEDFSL